MLDTLKKLSYWFLEIKNQNYKRYYIQTQPFEHRLTILTGARGVGKTTTLVQALLDHTSGDIFSEKILYVQSDHFLTKDYSLYEIAESFQASGGEILVFDEIHKYPNWSIELKSIYDTFPKLKLIASGSSALEIHKGSHDLSRRTIVSNMVGMSFREHLEMQLNLKLEAHTLENIIKSHDKISAIIIKKLAEKNKQVLPLFSNYLKYGYYPYISEIPNEALYATTLEQNIHTSIESDLVAIHPELTGRSVIKIRQLLSFIAESVPFTPAWKKLKETLDIGDERTLKNYFKYLQDAELITLVQPSGKKIRKLELLEKVYLNNTNQIITISPENANIGTLREIFFASMLKKDHQLSIPKKGDFLVKDKYTFEIGGRGKNFEQIKDIENAYLVCDQMERSTGKKIPLWLFGFLY